ncbi:MAG: glycosyltransferase family 39 protein [Ferruginibacter sp.]|nr:glycosyltransferase family 39 protein [Ferruginibacter sp.]
MNKNPGWIFMGLALIYVIGFGIDIMDIDAAQYASMSREMLESGNYLQVYDLGKDYLDKPPFLIWISAMSMKIFGVNNFAYRLPSFLFSLLAILSTYRFSRIFYDRSTSTFAAIILASCQAFFLINHDIRTDTILMSWVIFSLWQLAAWFNNGKFFHFVLGCAGIACGMMTKGPIALIVPLFAFGSHFLLQRNFSVFFKWQYIAGIFIIAILLLPMCTGLYQQFDLHPEKIVNKKTGVSGLRFFFWTQSFGRITGESDWNNKSNIFFLLQNMLWSFLPWILFFLIALLSDIKNIIQQRFGLLKGQEAITIGGFILTYLSLGLSKYQLPHYIFVVFPLAAIITAKFLNRLIFEKKHALLHNILVNIHFVIFCLLWVGLIGLLFYCFDSIPVFVPIMASAFFGIFLFLFFTKKKNNLIILVICLFSIMGINLFLNGSFYPALLRYQMGNVAGKWIHQQKIPANNIFIYQYEDFRSLDFYARAIIQHKDSLNQFAAGDWIITGEEKLIDLTSAQIKYDRVYEGKSFRVARLSFKFLLPKTREKQLAPYVIIKIK